MPLGTLESGTPLRELDAVAFSLTHELCYSNVLYMLDLAGIPSRSALRGEIDPLVIGGGAVFNAEPVAPFFDILMVGDGEEALPELLELIADCRAGGASRHELLRAATRLIGCCVPSFFEVQDEAGTVVPIFQDHVLIEKRIAPDLDRIDFPVDQVVPFGPVVHDRLSIEIARGCTRGCRFCQAGMIHRPMRERRLKTLESITSRALERTGFDELSFLSLSTGDYSCLDGLFTESL